MSSMIPENVLQAQSSGNSQKSNAAAAQKRRQTAIDTLAELYMQGGKYKSLDDAKKDAEKEIIKRANKLSKGGFGKRLTGTQDADFIDSAAAELTSEYKTKVLPATNAKKSVTGAPVLPSPSTKDGKYDEKGVQQQEGDAAEAMKDAADKGNPPGYIPTKVIENVGHNNAEAAQNSQKEQQTDRIVNTAKENLKGVPGALTGDDSSNNNNNNNNSGNGSGGGGGENTTENKSKSPQRYYSIWDAYYKGAFGEPGSKEAKGAAAYYTVDAIANHFKNVGRGIGNVGAQFTGGTIDNNESQSEWNKAMNVMNEEQRELWGEQMGGRRSRAAQAEKEDIRTKELANARYWSQNKIIKYAAEQFEKENDRTWKLFWGMVANGNLDAIAAIKNGKTMDFLDTLMDAQKDHEIK